MGLRLRLLGFAEEGVKVLVRLGVRRRLLLLPLLLLLLTVGIVSEQVRLQAVGWRQRTLRRLTILLLRSVRLTQPSERVLLIFQHAAERIRQSHTLALLRGNDLV